MALEPESTEHSKGQCAAANLHEWKPLSSISELIDAPFIWIVDREYRRACFAVPSHIGQEVDFTTSLDEVLT